MFSQKNTAVKGRRGGKLRFSKTMKKLTFLAFFKGKSGWVADRISQS